MTRPLRVAHYLNQFFGGIGAEEHAGVGVEVREGPVGPGRALQMALGDEATVVATIICGDNYFSDEIDTSLSAIGDALTQYSPDVVIAGPAFDAGRYGFACAEVCVAAQKSGIPAVTGMTPDNSGVITHRRELITVPTGTDLTQMQSVLEGMATLAVKLGRGKDLGPAAVEGYIPRGIRKPKEFEKAGAERAFDLLEARVLDQPWTSEVLDLEYEIVTPPSPVKDLSQITLALVSSGGVVPWGNPDELEQGRTTERYHKYSIEGLHELKVGEWESIHSGFNSNILNTEGPDYALPLRATRELEAQGVFKGLHPYFFSTAGNGMRVRAAKTLGEGIAAELKEADVGAVLLVAT